MEDINNPTNIKHTLTKLPYKLEEKWRSVSHKVKKRKEATFLDLVDFVNREARVATDPLFRDILESTTWGHKNEQRKGTFAVAVSSTQEERI